jgi:hypothetical protein
MKKPKLRNERDEPPDDPPSGYQGQSWLGSDDDDPLRKEAAERARKAVDPPEDEHPSDVLEGQTVGLN